MLPLSFKSFAATHKGKVRKLNEDAYVARDEIGLWAVADGMGGHEAGDLASQTVARQLESVSGEDNVDSLLESARKALNQANQELIGMEDQFRTGRVPGSTVAVLLADGNAGAVAWAGDSRIYRLRHGTADQITRDHSHVQELVDEKLIEAEEAESHPMANVITRAVGIDQPLNLDFARIDIRPGDRYMLCTDGLSRVVSFTEIRDLLDTLKLDESVHSLLQTALERGAPDNVTVVGVDCSETGKLPT